MSICGAALDAYRVRLPLFQEESFPNFAQLLDDLCLLTDGDNPEFLLAASLAQNFGLELIESVLLNHADTIMNHPEQLHILRSRLMPLIIKILSEKASFSTTVRTMRLLQLIFSRLLLALASECEVALSLLNHMLDPDAAVLWKRALCLEVFRGIHSEPVLVRFIYSHYDEADEKRNIIRDHLGSLVRLASEKPAVIGLGQKSSVPAASTQNDDSSDQAAVQTGGLIGGIGATVALPDLNRSGISTQWSSIRTPCIEQLDKFEAPNLPATYIYSLALTCITSFSEGLARFLLPFTVPVESKAKRKQPVIEETDENKHANGIAGKLTRNQSFGGRKVPVNPLSLKDHVLYSQISTSGHMVDHCWPALLAASSTYLNATLDSENYHALIRSFQKFTQIAGLLDLTTPRDAFLTTLGKHAVSSTNPTSIASPLIGYEPEATDSGRDSSPAPPTPSSRRPQSSDFGVPTMNTRHLLCLRALLNLGIALGPVLQRSWTIILESLLQADLIISLSAPARVKQLRRPGTKVENDASVDSADGGEDLKLEITAAETAASRLFESTADLPSEAFMEFTACLSSLLQIGNSAGDSLDGLFSPQPVKRKHQKVRSVSGVAIDDGALDQSNSFVLDKIDDVVQSNVVRLLQHETQETGWDLLVEVLTQTLSMQKGSSNVRIKAATTLNGLLAAVVVSGESLTFEERDFVQARSLDALLNEISSLRKAQPLSTITSQKCESEIHRRVLEALRSILEHCGESLSLGWNTVFSIVNSIFKQSPISEEAARLVRSSFGSLQLICSDFLGSVPFSCLLVLLDTLHAFCAQDLDLNISLTVSAFLLHSLGKFTERATQVMVSS